MATIWIRCWGYYSFLYVSSSVSVDAAFYYIIFYDLLEMLNYEFRLGQHSTGNWIENLLSLLDCLTEDIKKKLERGRDWQPTRAHTRSYMIINVERGKWINWFIKGPKVRRGLSWHQIWIKAPQWIKLRSGESASLSSHSFY